MSEAAPFGPIANAIGAPLSNALIEMFDWRWMFFIESLPAVILGIVVFCCLPDRVEDATFLDTDQKRALRTALDAQGDRSVKHASLLPYCATLRPCRWPSSIS